MGADLGPLAHAFEMDVMTVYRLTTLSADIDIIESEQSDNSGDLCNYYNFCPHQMPQCKDLPPEWNALEKDHLVFCHKFSRK